MDAGTARGMKKYMVIKALGRGTLRVNGRNVGTVGSYLVSTTWDPKGYLHWNSTQNRSLGVGGPSEGEVIRSLTL